jgi:hypothetical protein
MFRHAGLGKRIKPAAPNHRLMKTDGEGDGGCGGRRDFPLEDIPGNVRDRAFFIAAEATRSPAFSDEAR